MKKWKMCLINGVFCVSLLFTGCGKTEETEDSVFTIEQNDYAGGYYRSQLLVEDVENIIEKLSDHNYLIQLENPKDYWSEEEFYHVDIAAFKNDALNDINLLNEQEDFANVQTYIATVLGNNGYSYPSVIRKEKDKYQVSYSGNFLNEYNWQQGYGSRTMTCIYDAGKNRLQVLSYLNISGKEYEDFLYEFAEVSEGIYVMQNDTDRLYVVYDEDRQIEEFYYSSLMECEEEIIKEDVQSDFDLLFGTDEKEDDGILRTSWKNLKNDSIYTDLLKCDKDWVFEKSNFKTQISFANDELFVQSVNNLTGGTYSFIFSTKEMVEFTYPTEDESSTEATEVETTD